MCTDGIGDTIRVSLTEDSIHEIPVAKALVAAVCDRREDETVSAITGGHYNWDPFSYLRRPSEAVIAEGVEPGSSVVMGGEETVRVAIRRESFKKIAHKIERMGDYKPEFVYENCGVVEVDPCDSDELAELNRLTTPCLVTVRDEVGLPVITAFRLLAAGLNPRHPILLKDRLPISQDPQADFLRTLLAAATNIGALLCDGIGDAVIVQGEHGPGQALRLSYNILQAAGARIFKTDYVACPSCGRTLFNLQTTTAKIKAATVHLKGVKIAIMGCIVNGPGEMADADFGYVGGAPGKVNLYVGKTAVKFNIPEAEAVDRLQDLIREHGKWVDPLSDRAAGVALDAEAVH